MIVKKKKKKHTLWHSKDTLLRVISNVKCNETLSDKEIAG